MEAKRDSNSVTTALGVSDDATTITAFHVDPATDRLLVAITLNGSFSVTDPETLPRDGNRVPVGGAITDDANENIVPLYVDNATGALQVDLVME